MNWSLTGTMSEKILTYAKKIIGMGGFFILYLKVIRPFRAIFSEEVVYKGLLSGEISLGNAYYIQSSARQVIITFVSGDLYMVLSYIPQFGFFFLLGMLGVIYFLPSLKVYLLYVGVLFFIEFLVLISIWVGVQFWVGGFIVSKLLIVYISPMICLGTVLFLYLNKKGKLNEAFG